MSITKKKLSTIAEPIGSIKRKVQSYVGSGEHMKALCVPFIDARDVCMLLNEVFLGERTEDYEVISRTETSLTIQCTITICGVARKDVGTATLGNTDIRKSTYSDAFKRAAVKRGVGAFLYEMEIMKIGATTYKNKKKPTDKNGNILRSNEEITDYCKKIYEYKQNMQKKDTTPQPAPVEPPTPVETTTPVDSDVEPSEQISKASDIADQLI